MVLVAPVAAGIVRKFWPAQPPWIEGVPNLLILPALLLPNPGKRKLPPLIGTPIIALCIFTLVYALAAAAVSPFLGAAVVITRILPLGLVWLGYRAVRSSDDLVWLARRLVVVTFASTPAAAWTFFQGSEMLPSVFLPIETVLTTGKYWRSGVEMFSGLLTTPWILSHTAFAVAGISLAAIRKGSLPSVGRWLSLGYVLSLFLLYMSARRGLFFGALLATAMGSVLFTRGRRKTAFPLGLLIVLLFVLVQLDASSFVKSRYQSGSFESRGELFRDDPLSGRLDAVFVPLLFYWIDNAPFGSYLGAAGPEGWSTSPVGRSGESVEVGAAQLVAETGIMGLAVFVLCVVGAWIATLRVAMGAQHDAAHAVGVLFAFAVVLFITYLGKELLSLCNPSMGQYMFWTELGIAASLAAVRVSEPK